MDEIRFATLARQYVDLLSHQNDLKPATWSQEDHIAEYNRRMKLLSEMRDALNTAY